MNDKLNKAKNILGEYFTQTHFARNRCSGDNIDKERDWCHKKAEEFINLLIEGIKNEI